MFLLLIPIEKVGIFATICKKAKNEIKIKKCTN